MAALNVVNKRLEEVGLGRYCLNLHNYRGNKKEVIKQLITELETSPKIKESVKRYSFTDYTNNQKELNNFYLTNFFLYHKAYLLATRRICYRDVIQLHRVDFFLKISGVAFYKNRIALRKRPLG